jgi:predicted MFS family arabinose efflux permease
MNTAADVVPSHFTGYQKLVVGILTFLQFAVILDFMLMSPLGALIMPALDITPAQFGTVVSVYAFSAGVSGFLTAGFADRFDRKKLLLFFFAGFILGTLWCGLAHSFTTLLLARIVTGLFGGVIGSVVIAIATDLFVPQMRGRVMGFIQTAFAASQVLGIPFGLYLSTRWDWHIPFIALAAFAAAGGVFILWRMKPVAEHLAVAQERSAFAHLFHTVSEPRYLLAFATMTLLATGGFMLMPFSTAFTVSNLGIHVDHLPTIYLVTGLCTIFVGPLVGKATDTIGRLPVFLAGTTLTIVMVVIYTNLGVTSLAVVIVINVVLFIGIFSRMIPFQALISQVPSQTQRGSFNAISASISQLSGGLASVVAGQIVILGADGRLLRYDIAGYVVVFTSVLSATMLWYLHQHLSLSR